MASGTVKSFANAKVITSGSLHDIKAFGIYYLTTAVTDRPSGSTGGVYVVGEANGDTVTGLFIDEYDGRVFHVRGVDNVWTSNEVTIPPKVTITGTTSSSGALSIPSQYQSLTFVNAVIDGAVGFVFRRDLGYFTVLNNDLTPKANTSVTLSVLFV